MTYALLALRTATTIARTGTTLTLTQSPTPAFAPATGVVALAAPTAEAISAVILPLSDTRDASLERGTTVRGARRRLLIAAQAPGGGALAFEPAPGQQVAIGGTNWTLAALSRIAPDGGTVVYYDAEVRQ